MKLDIPFYKNDNDGKQCMQVAMKCVIEYFLDTKISLDELDKLTKRKEGLWTWTSQIVTVLHNRSLKVKYYSKTDLEPFLEGEPFILKHFGNDAKTVLKFTDLPVVLESIQELLKYDVFEKSKRKNIIVKTVLLYEKFSILLRQYLL
mgnify:CR=1 FL=1